MRRPSKKRKNFITFFLFGFLLISLGLIMLIFKLGFFNIKNTEILGDEIIARKPVAMLIGLQNIATTSAFLEEVSTPSAQDASNYFLIDHEGVIFSKALEKLDIPNIFFADKDILVGEKAEGDFENALKVLSKVKEFGVDTQTSQILNSFLIIFSLPKIIFRLDADINTQIASLQLILKTAKIDQVKLEFIDLRFDKPIVKFAPQK